MRRFGRPTEGADSLSFIYYTDARNKREEKEKDDEDATVSPLSGGAPRVEKVELYAVENAGNHRTDKYELVTEQKTPVLRRGQPFYLAVKARDGEQIDLGRHRLKVTFQFGQSGSVPKGTKVVLEASAKQRLDRPKAQWDVIVHRQSGPTTILQIHIGCGCPVGVWKCEVEISNRRSSGNNNSSEKPKTFPVKEPFYILFNPYCKDDTVFMPNEGDLDEYVQNDVGKVWKGGYKQYGGRHWVFGQFESVVLPACCFILDRSGVRPSERGNPVRVSRAISAMVNSVDDAGVVAGRWSEPYDDGVEPWEWTGSADILEKYMESGGEPVKYGQCWVFSAVLQTVCRALGLPCRSVTNFVSAHDTNNSLTIDRFFNEEGEEMTAKDSPEIGYDSIWNFHVWNDAWMARPDLPAGYGGWQAIDATPQEASENVYQCGPAPIEAVRRGEVGLGFDVAFLFAEVNADVCHFVRDPSSDWGFKRTKLNKYHVGRLLVTKAAGYYDKYGDKDAEDITSQYKNSEGTEEERLAVYNAVRGVDKGSVYYDMPGKASEDVVMDLIELDSATYGEPYKARVTLENKSDSTRTIKALISSSSIYYTGITAHPVKKAQGEFVLSPGQKDTLALTIYPEDYMGRLVEYCMMKIYALMKVIETNQTWSDEDDFVLEKPKLKLEVSAGTTPRKYRLCQLEITVPNPLSVPLTRCRVSVECAGVVRKVVERAEDVPPNSSIVHKVFLLPRKATEGGTLVATFTSKEMIDVYGSCAIVVKE